MAGLAEGAGQHICPAPCVLGRNGGRHVLQKCVNATPQPPGTAVTKPMVVLTLRHRAEWAQPVHRGGADRLRTVPLGLSGRARLEPGRHRLCAQHRHDLGAGAATPVGRAGRSTSITSGFANLLGLVLLGISAWMLVATPTLGPVLAAQLMHSLGELHPDAGDRRAHAGAVRPGGVQRAAGGQRALCLHRQRLGRRACWGCWPPTYRTAPCSWPPRCSSCRRSPCCRCSATAIACPRTTIRRFCTRRRAACAGAPALAHLRRAGFLVFVIARVLFQFGNAAMLQLALSELAKRTGGAGLVVSAAIIVPQIIVALFSPMVGRLAQSLRSAAGPAGGVCGAADTRACCS